MKKETIKELKALEKHKDIDTSDIPESTDWEVAEVGRFYRPMKKKLTIRLDMDVISWF